MNAIDPLVADISLSSSGRALALWAQNKDRGALHQALAAAEPTARAVARSMQRDPSAVEDITQETLLQLMRSAGRYDPERSFHAWVHHLARTACLRWRRSEGRRRRYEGSAPGQRASGGIDPLERDELTQQVRAAMAELPLGMREAVELHYVGGLSQGDTAAALGSKENAIAVRLHRARQRLAETLRRRGITTASATLASLLAPRAAPRAADTVVGWAGAPPATTLPLSAAQQALFIVGLHPSMATAALLLCGVVVALTVGWQPGRPIQTAAGATVEDDHAEAVHEDSDTDMNLQWTHPQAAFTALIEGEVLWRDLRQVAPFTAATDPRLQDLVSVIGADIQLQVPWDVRTLLLMTAWRARAASVSLFDATGDHDEVWAIDTSGATDSFHGGLSADGGHWAGRQIGPFTTTGAIDAERALAWHGPRMLLGDPQRLQEWWGVPDIPLPDRPVEIVFFPRGLMDAFRAMVPADQASSFSGLWRLLGPDWQQARPIMGLTAGVEDSRLQAHLRMQGTRPLDPIDLLELWARDGDFAAWGNLLGDPRPFDPRYRFPDHQPLLVFEAGWDMDASRMTKGDGYWGATLLTAIRSCSGDVRLVVEPGSPHPVMTAILGLRELANLAPIMEVIGARRNDQAQRDAGIIDRWWIPSPVGRLLVTQWPDRLVLTTTGDPTAGRGVAADTATSEAHIQLTVRCAELWQQTRGLLPMVLNALEVEASLANAALAAHKAIADHLPDWRLHWTTTEEGFELHEEGLPMVSALLAWASFKITRQFDPEALSDVRDTVRWVSRVRRHQEAIELLRTLAQHVQVDQETRRIDRAAALRGAGLTPADLQRTIPALAEWDPETPCGWLHDPVHGDVSLEGIDPAYILDRDSPAVVTSSFGSSIMPGSPEDRQSEDVAWTIPITARLFAHIDPGSKVILEWREGPAAGGRSGR